MADKIAQIFNLSPRQRLELQGLIISTSFHDANIKPATKMEKLLSLADVGGFTEDWPDFLADNVKLLGEMKITTIQGWLKMNLGFLKNVGKQLEELKNEFQEMVYAKQLDLLDKWKESLDAKLKIIQTCLVDSNCEQMGDIEETIGPALSRPASTS